MDKKTGKSPLLQSSLCRHREQGRRSLLQILGFQSLYHPEQVNMQVQLDTSPPHPQHTEKDNTHLMNKKKTFFTDCKDFRQNFQ